MVCVRLIEHPQPLKPQKSEGRGPNERVKILFTQPLPFTHREPDCKPISKKMVRELDVELQKVILEHGPLTTEEFHERLPEDQQWMGTAELEDELRSSDSFVQDDSDRWQIYAEMRDQQ